MTLQRISFEEVYQITLPGTASNDIAKNFNWGSISNEIIRNCIKWHCKEKVQKDKQRSTKHTYKTKDRVTRTSLKTGVELRCSWRVSNSCSTSDTRRVNLVKTLNLSNNMYIPRSVHGSFTFSQNIIGSFKSCIEMPGSWKYIKPSVKVLNYIKFQLNLGSR